MIKIPWRNLKAQVGRLRAPDEALLVGTAFFVGLGAGAGAVVFRWLIDSIEYLSFQWLPSVSDGMGSTYLIVAPTLGGLVVGLLIYFFAQEARGHGVPEVMEAVALKGGRIRPVVAVIKSLASSLCIGSGGSVGREGPIVQIGSALGSTVGQVLKLPDDSIRNLVACGAAGGIAATFNAPIAGVLFALEIISGDFSVRGFGSVVVSAVMASVVGRASFGDTAAFVVPAYTLNSLWELPMYVILAVLCAFLAVGYTRSIYRTEDLFDKLRWVPEWGKPAIGGMILGGVALLYGTVPGLTFEGVPQIYGVGYETIEQVLQGRHLILMMLALMGLKILATSLSLGSGGSGGVFAPSLFVGSMLGGTFGLLMHSLFPGIPGPIGAYALVGMGALFAGATHASMTAVVIMFEMTGDYKIILPLMLAVVTSSLITRALMNGETVYTLKLTRRGVRLRRGRVVDVLEEVSVEEIMIRDFVTVRKDTPIEDLTDLFLSTHRHAFPVLDEKGELSGIVSLYDLRRANRHSEDLRVGDLMTPSVVTAFPDESLDAVLLRMGPDDLSRLPVVSRERPRHLLGVVRRNEVVRAYNLALASRMRHNP